MPASERSRLYLVLTLNSAILLLTFLAFVGQLGGGAAPVRIAASSLGFAVFAGFEVALLRAARGR